MDARRNTSLEDVRPAVVQECASNKTHNNPVRSVMIPQSIALSTHKTTHPICTLFKSPAAQLCGTAIFFIVICLIPVIEYVKPVTTFLRSTQKNMKHTGTQTAVHNAQGRQKVGLVRYSLHFH